MKLADPHLTAWAIPRIRAAADSDVSAIVPTAAGVVAVERVGMPSFIAVLLDMQRVAGVDVDSAVSAVPGLKFVSNIPRNSVIDGSAWTHAAARQVGLGRMGDLMRALREPDVAAYQNPEIRFIERGLRQHSAVADFRRLDDVRYEILRSGMPTLLVAMLNNYEVTADVVRSAWDKYGPFEVAVATNPNARETTSAAVAASALNVGVLRWGQLLGRLNSP